MKSSPIKYSFVRIANWLICFWFNIMIIQGSEDISSSLSSISHSVFISHGISWVTHGISCECFDNVYPPSGWSVESGDQGGDIMIWWLSEEGGSQCLSRSSNSHKCVIIRVWIVSTHYHFKCDPHFCVQVVVVAVNKMNFRHLTADTSDSVSRLQTKQLLSPMRWCGHQ